MMCNSLSHLFALCAIVQITLYSFSQACGSGPACGTDEYCDGGTCTSIPYSQYPINSGIHSTGTNVFDIVMATDIQLYFRNCKDAPEAECIYTNVDDDDDIRDDLLREATGRQVNCIQNLATSSSNDVKAIFDNGDITNTATSEQLDDYKTLFREPLEALNIPLPICLGNHDYGKSIAPKEGRQLMIKFFESTVDDLTNSGFAINDIDYSKSSKVTDDDLNEDQYHNKGSLSYSFQMNGFMFIILHWSTGQTSGGNYRDEFDITESTFTDYYYINSVRSFLRKQLRVANRRNIPVILVPHSWRGLKKFIEEQSFASTIESSSVFAVLAGHDHDQWGFFTDYLLVQRTIKVYYAGSATYQKLIMARLDPSQETMVVTPYDTAVEPCEPTSPDTDTAEPTTNRFVARAYDELRVELNGKNRVLSLCDVNVYPHKSTRPIMPFRMTQSSTNSGLHAEHALSTNRTHCSETTVGDMHYWAAHFRPGYPVNKVKLEGNENISGSLVGSKLFWNNRLIGTIGNEGNLHKLPIKV